jgi:transposase
MGLQRGGNDKIAAMQIAQYACRYHDRLRLWKPSNANLEQLRQYISQRDRLVLVLNQLTVPLQELEETGQQKQSSQLSKLQAPACRAIVRSIERIEAVIDKLIESNIEIKEVIQRVSSIKGIGKQTAINLYVYTKAFTEFENAKQLACYCGVVPFTKTSGTSVRYKTGVSPYANRKLKKLLHLCAMAAIRWNDDMKRYYEKKVGEGKNKMSVINAVRNKLIHRIFAVVRDQRMYVENLWGAS